MEMKQSRILSFTTRIGLFLLILYLGTMAALMLDEQPGSALTDLSSASVQAIAAAENSDVRYAAVTNGAQPTGLYRSDDAGHSWQLVCSGPGLEVKALAVHPANEALLFAGTRGGARETSTSLWRSADGGRTWYPLRPGLPANAYDRIPTVTTLAVDPGQPESLFIGTDGEGLFRFQARESVKIEAINDGLPFVAHISDLAVGPKGRLYAIVNFGLYEYSDDAWQAIETLPEQVVSLGVTPTARQTLYVGSPSSGVYRSTDGGRTWTQMSDDLEMITGAPLHVTTLAVDQRDLTHVVAGTAYLVGHRLAGGAIHESRDGGQHWTKLDDIDGLAHQVVIQGDRIDVGTTQGLLQFGPPEKPSPLLTLPDLDRLVRPTGIQALILILTAALAASALLGRIEWFFDRSRGKIQ